MEALWCEIAAGAWDLAGVGAIHEPWHLGSWEMARGSRKAACGRLRRWLPEGLGKR